MEIIKVFYYVDVTKKYPDKEFNEILFYMNDGKWNLQFLGKAMLTAEVTEDFCEQIRCAFGKKLEQVKDEEMHIDFNWAVRFINQ